ncbi:MAG: AAA-like domain-containing protein [Cyanobacteria bacterium P01_G01_bin.67]
MTELEISQALRIVDRILEPEKLNGVQELVLRECWLGKTYQEIASGSGYDSDYIRVVGSRLWQNLSLAFEEKISKNNFKSVLENKAKKAYFAGTTLIFPDGQVPLNSHFYIERPPAEEQAFAEVLNPGALIVIKSPLNMGKTSLMTRVLAQARAQNYHTVSLNLQLAEASVLCELEKFLRWLMANITLQLGIESVIDQYWDQDLGTKISCTNYFQQHILEQLSSPLVLALDEVNHLFEYPKIAQEFLPLLRFWREEASNTEIWQRLRMIMVHSTDVYIPLEINQSPFNLGLPLTLPEFNLEQVRELAHRHQFQLEAADLEQNLISLLEMVGGYPYLIRLAFYALSTQEISFQQLLAEAPTPSGIYRDHLQEYHTKLLKYPELSSAFNEVVAADSPVQISSLAAYKLESMGLIRLSGNKVIPSCQLYRIYFRDYIAA